VFALIAAASWYNTRGPEVMAWRDCAGCDCVEFVDHDYYQERRPHSQSACDACTTSAIWLCGGSLKA
jgi:hypothetical protein